MYRATCLASSVLPAQTAIKHLLGSMQLISSNNKMSQWSRESGFDSVTVVVETGWLLPVGKREMCLFRWRLVARVSIISPSLYSSLRVMYSMRVNIALMNFNKRIYGKWRDLLNIDGVWSDVPLARREASLHQSKCTKQTLSLVY